MCVELVEGKTAVYGIIGDRVEKSFSPVLQNTIGREMGVNMVYVPFKVESGRVRAAVEGGRAMNIRGFNVTVPHKIEVMDALASVDETAARIGAVNTLKLTENGYEGYNTDIIGLKKCFDERKTSLKGRNVVLAGAGGAANSAAILAGEEKAAKLVIVNRTAEKAEALAERVRKYYDTEVDVIGYDGLMDIAEPEIFIQTTSVGMGSDETPVAEKEFFKNVGIVVDIIYTPWETRLMREVKEMGAAAVNGFDMLFYQGLASFEIWNDMKVEPEKALELKKKLTEFYRGRA